MSLLWSLRTRVNRSTGCKPFFLVYGAKAIPSNLNFDALGSASTMSSRPRSSTRQSLTCSKRLGTPSSYSRPSSERAPLGARPATPRRVRRGLTRGLYLCNAGQHSCPAPVAKLSYHAWEPSVGHLSLVSGSCPRRGWPGNRNIGLIPSTPSHT
jgi:hypothetical protein